MPAKLRRVLRKPVTHLLLDALRVGGTRGFLACVGAARRLRLLPRAYSRNRDQPGILVVAPTPHLGDAVMLMPLLEALAADGTLPVDLVIECSVAAMFAGTNGLRTVYPLRLGTVPPIGTWASMCRVGAVVREYWLHLRRCRPSICLMPRWGDDLFRAFYLAALTGAPRGIGFAADLGAPRYALAPYRDRLLTEIVRGGRGLHEPARFLLLAERAGLLPPGDASVAGQQTSHTLQHLAAGVPWEPLRRRLQVPSPESYAVVAPGTTQAHKLWPAEHWQAVIAALTQRGLVTVLLSGTADRAIAERIHHLGDEPTVLVAGATSLAESAALLQHAAIFLGNDSGPAHLAGALGVPTIVLFTAAQETDADDPFSPERNRPAGPHVHVVTPEPTGTGPSQPRVIAPERVIAVVDRVLAATPELVAQ